MLQLIALLFVGLTVAPVPAAAMPICGSGKRITCVVDGDTVWIAGEKIRLENIDAPEVQGRCPVETDLARRSTVRLAELLRQGPVEITRSGKDRYRRTLARLTVAGRDVGAVLITEGLARPWQGRKEEWCPVN